MYFERETRGLLSQLVFIEINVKLIEDCFDSQHNYSCSVNIGEFQAQDSWFVILNNIP